MTEILTSIQWIYVVGGFVTTVVASLGIWAYYRTVTRTRTNEALESTIKIYKTQIEALNSQAVMLQKQAADLVAVSAARELEVTKLQSRTDLTSVLDMLKQVIEDNRRHDTSIADTLKAAISTGSERYTVAMQLMHNMMDYLTKTAEAAHTQSEQNYALITKVVVSMESLSRRFGVIEDKVDLVKEAVADGESPETSLPPVSERRSRPR